MPQIVRGSADVRCGLSPKLLAYVVDLGFIARDDIERGEVAWSRGG
jgi:hypothetical protein